MAEEISNGQPPRPSMYEDLKDECIKNCQVFTDEKSETAKTLYRTFNSIKDTLVPLVELKEEVMKHCSKYDFDTNVQANGYRSLVKMVDIIVKRTLKVCRKISSNRSSYFFRKRSIEKDLEACSQALSGLCSCLIIYNKLLKLSANGSLFPTEPISVKDLLSGNPGVNQYGFYGRCVGFQFCDSISAVVKMLIILMASFSEVYYGGSKVIDSLWTGGRYFLDAELRAKRVVNLSQYASANFCKKFWSFGELELMHRMPNFINPLLPVNKVITIESQSIDIIGDKGVVIHIPPPSAHRGAAPVVGRLLSATRRLGMVEATGIEGLKEASNWLLIHCHGGGFMAQSSRSHESYLRQWARVLDCPILSIDYSLAPEAPYPRAIEEVFFAYCWALINCHLLGTTAERIVVAGDSAGANISIALTMKCIEFGVRPPNGLFVTYVPILLSFVPSPSRILCLADPILTFGFLLNCCRAYGYPPEKFEPSSKHEVKLKRKILTADVKSSTDVLDGRETASASSGSVQNPAEKKEDYDDNEVELEMQREAMLPCPEDMMHIDVPEDPYMSPYFIPDRILNLFPPTTIVTTEMDPFLDDCIEFARRLRLVGNNVNLEVLTGLCHGFLNFAMLSKEANEGSKVCVNWIKKMLDSNQQQSSPKRSP